MIYCFWLSLMVNIDHPVIKMFQFNVLLVRLLTSMQSSTIYDVLTVRGSFQPYENRLYTRWVYHSCAQIYTLWFSRFIFARYQSVKHSTVGYIFKPCKYVHLCEYLPIYEEGLTFKISKVTTSCTDTFFRWYPWAEFTVFRSHWP